MVLASEAAPARRQILSKGGSPLYGSRREGIGGMRVTCAGGEHIPIWYPSVFLTPSGMDLPGFNLDFLKYDKVLGINGERINASRQAKKGTGRRYRSYRGASAEDDTFNCG